MSKKKQSNFHHFFLFHKGFLVASVRENRRYFFFVAIGIYCKKYIYLVCASHYVVFFRIFSFCKVRIAIYLFL